MFDIKTLGKTILGIAICCIIALVIRIPFIRALIFSLVLLAFGIFMIYRIIFSLGNAEWSFFKRAIKAMVWIIICFSYTVGLIYFMPLLWKAAFR